MKTISVTEAHKKFSALIDDISASHKPVQIIGKHSSAVLISADDWRAIQETLYLHSVPGMADSIIEGLNMPVDQCSEECNH